MKLIYQFNKMHFIKVLNKLRLYDFFPPYWKSKANVNIVFGASLKISATKFKT